MTVGTFWELVNEGCSLFGGSVISGRRSKQRNQQVGGHPRSRHLHGLAADIVFDHSVQTWRAFAWLKRKGLHGYVKPSGRSLHIQDRAARAPTRRA